MPSSAAASADPQGQRWALPDNLADPRMAHYQVRGLEQRVGLW